MAWNDKFLEVFDKWENLYQDKKDPLAEASTEDLAYLKTIGYKPRELFDFVEDLVDQDIPSKSTALLVAAVRRDYFAVIQKNSHSSYEIKRDELPPFEEELEGIAYLPRIIAKAEAKLRGELDPDIMYGCGADRRFLLKYEIEMADFLRHVWAADGDHQQIVNFVKK